MPTGLQIDAQAKQAAYAEQRRKASDRVLSFYREKFAGALK